MVRLEENKRRTENKAIEKIPLPASVYIPLSQHLGKMCNPEVKMGDPVLAGQRIAGVSAHVWAPIHASISGKVTSIQEWPHPVLGRCKAIVIEGDGEDKSHLVPNTQHKMALGARQIPPRAEHPAQNGTRCEANPTSCRTPSTKWHSVRGKSQPEIDNLTAEQIRNLVFEAGIVGLGGASFPTHIKLNPPKPVDTLIINGAECEPYLTGDYRLMVEKTREILLGTELILRCLGVKKIYIAIEDNKPEAIKAFEAICDKRYVISVLKSMYPQGGEKQLIKNILGKEVPQGKLPFDIGVLVHNVATCFAIYEAVYLNKPLYERVVTVTGSCISNPKNLLVRIGTPIKDLIDYCGPLKEEPAKIIIGGPMMGLAQFSDKVPVIKSTTGILLFNQKEADSQEELPCIRCAACIRECPVSLMPTLISLASEKGLWSQAASYGASDCIECGICAYVCPANIRLVQRIKRAKLELVK